MKIQRIVKHLWFTDWQLRRLFPRNTLDAIELAIKVSEATHSGEIRFAVEGSLDGWPLFKGQSARERAIEVFSQLRMWDTEHNNGVLIYVLLADQAVEIVADRGIHARAGTPTWSAICQQMELAFSKADYESGALKGIEAVTRTLNSHFPYQGKHMNELSDEPALLI